MRITVLSSNTQAIININNKNIINTITKSVNTVIIHNNNIYTDLSLPQNISIFDTIIIATCGSNNDLSPYKKYGITINKSKNNYVFIKQNNKIIFEKVSNFPIMYPLVSYTNILCKHGIDRLTPKYNIFSNISNTNQEVRHLCALESHSLGYTKFAIREGICFPLQDFTPNNYPDTANCLDGSGNTYATNIYEFNILNTPVILNNNISLMEGEYKSNMSGAFKHIKIPTNFIVYLINGDFLEESILGPNTKNISANIDKIIIKTVTNNMVVIGENDNKFIILEKGSHMLDKYFWLNMNYIRFIDQQNIYYVNLYANINFTNFIAKVHNENTYDIFGLFKLRITTINNKTNIEYPQVVRSIIIQ